MTKKEIKSAFEWKNESQVSSSFESYWSELCPGRRSACFWTFQYSNKGDFTYATWNGQKALREIGLWRTKHLPECHEFYKLEKELYSTEPTKLQCATLKKEWRRECYSRAVLPNTKAFIMTAFYNLFF